MNWTKINSAGCTFWARLTAENTCRNVWLGMEMVDDGVMAV